jgi:hypothetical protein
MGVMVRAWPRAVHLLCSMAPIDGMQAWKRPQLE